MKHSPVLADPGPQKADYANWHDWMKARSLWFIDNCHARERAERRQRWGWK